MFPPELESTQPGKDTIAKRSVEHLDHVAIVGWSVAFGSLWIWAFLHGFDDISTVISLTFTMLFGMVLFLQTRPKARKATLAERVVATAWRWARLLVAAAAIVILGILPIVGFILKPERPGDDYWTAIILVPVTVGLAIWIGLYGWTRNPKRDVTLHAERKKRYGWWF